MAKIHDVAQAAGVSISTVSYALSGKRPVSPDTRRRIEQAARDLDYRPNAGARMLAGRRTNIFALTEPLHAQTYAPTHMAFVLATSIAARRKDYDVLLLTEEEVARGMRRVASSGLVDAVLVFDVAPEDERVAVSREISVPTVFVGVPSDPAGLICVDLDFESAAAMAVDALADAGHQTLGLIGHPPQSYECSNFPPRVRDAFAARAHQRGLVHELRMPQGPGTAAERTRRALTELLALGVTGFVLHCSEEAHVAVLDELQRRGVRVPEDVSLVSVGATFDTTALSVPLSAVPLVASRSCDLAVELATRAVDGAPVERRVHLIAPTLEAHGSVARPGAARPGAAGIPAAFAPPVDS